MMECYILGDQRPITRYHRNGGRNCLKEIRYMRISLQLN